MICVSEIVSSYVLKKMLFLVSFFKTMLYIHLHSCLNLVYVFGYNRNGGSFRDCLVSHCGNVFIVVFLLFFVFFSFVVAFVASKGI